VVFPDHPEELPHPLHLLLNLVVVPSSPCQTTKHRQKAGTDSIQEQVREDHVPYCPFLMTSNPACVQCYVARSSPPPASTTTLTPHHSNCCMSFFLFCHLLFPLCWKLFGLSYVKQFFFLIDKNYFFCHPVSVLTYHRAGNLLSSRDI